MELQYLLWLEQLNTFLVMLEGTARLVKRSLSPGKALKKPKQELRKTLLQIRQLPPANQGPVAHLKITTALNWQVKSKLNVQVLTASAAL